MTPIMMVLAAFWKPKNKIPSARWKTHFQFPKSASDADVLDNGVSIDIAPTTTSSSTASVCKSDLFALGCDWSTSVPFLSTQACRKNKNGDLPSDNTS